MKNEHIKPGAFITLVPGVVLAACLTQIARFPYSTINKFEVGDIISLNSFEPPSTFLLIISGIASLIALTYGLKSKNRLSWLLLPPIVYSPISFFRAEMNPLMAFNDAGVIRDGNNEYHMLALSFLQGRCVAITKVRDQHDSITEHEILVSSSLDTSGGTLPLVRPKQITDNDIFVLSPERLLVACPYRSETNIVYDIDSAKPYTQYSREGQIWKLSPFLLVGPSDHLKDDDAKDFLAFIPGEGDDERLTKQTIAEDLVNPNPEVKALVSAYLDSHKN